jgi:hypothetical protein
MTDDQTKEVIRNFLRVLGRHGEQQLDLVGEMNKRELSQGVQFAECLHDMVQDVNEWLGHVADRVLQDQANAET